MLGTGVLGWAFERVIIMPVYGQHLKQILITTGGLIVAEQLIHVFWGGDQKPMALPTALRGAILLGDIAIEKYRLLAVVIGAFSLSGIVFMKMLGIGMLLALLVDATVVRALLVPSTMKVLGHWNWWAPGPLRRLYARYGIREDDGDVPPPLPAPRLEPEFTGSH